MNILITGASKGIGQALASEFAKNGHNLILVARSLQLLNEFADQLKLDFNVDVDFVATDLASKDNVHDLVQIIEKRGHIVDCLVNNAGIGYLGEFIDMTDEQLYALIQLNISCLSLLTRHYAKEFSQRGRGKILQIASLAGFQPGPLMAVYYASKAYVIVLSQALRNEFKARGVSVSILCPGPTSTHFFEEAVMQNSFLARGVMGLMSPEKVAEIAYRGLMKNKQFIVPGIMNKILAFITRITPSMISMPIAKLSHRKKVF